MNNCIYISKNEILYSTAKAYLDIDASPKDKAPDDLACMESVDDILWNAFGFYVNGTRDVSTLSTGMGYKWLQDKDRFKKVKDYTHGLIIISPTGKGKWDHGHVGITGKYQIMSNNSQTGLFDTKFTYESWKQYYGVKGNFPVELYQVL